jgi:hypothetical protein
VFIHPYSLLCYFSVYFCVNCDRWVFFFFFFFVVVVGWLVNCHIKRTKKGKGELPKQYQTATLTRSVKSARGLQEFNLLQLHQNEDKVQGDRVVAKQHNNLVLNQP